MSVVNLSNTNALLQPDVQAFFKKALPPGNLLIPLGFDGNPEPVVNAITAPNGAVLIGLEDGEWKGMAMVGLPNGVDQTDPYVGHFYNEGKAALRDELIKAVVDFVVQNGYTSFVVLNGSGKADEAWIKMFRKAGEPTKVASIYRFKIG